MEIIKNKWYVLSIIVPGALYCMLAIAIFRFSDSVPTYSPGIAEMEDALLERVRANTAAPEDVERFVSASVQAERRRREYDASAKTLLRKLAFTGIVVSVWLIAIGTLAAVKGFGFRSRSARPQVNIAAGP